MSTKTIGIWVACLFAKNTLQQHQIRNKFNYSWYKMQDKIRIALATNDKPKKRLIISVLRLKRTLLGWNNDRFHCKCFSNLQFYATIKWIQIHVLTKECEVWSAVTNEFNKRFSHRLTNSGVRRDYICDWKQWKKYSCNENLRKKKYEICSPKYFVLPLW